MEHSCRNPQTHTQLFLPGDIGEGAGRWLHATSAFQTAPSTSHRQSQILNRRAYSLCPPYRSLNVPGALFITYFLLLPFLFKNKARLLSNRTKIQKPLRTKCSAQRFIEANPAVVQAESQTASGPGAILPVFPPSLPAPVLLRGNKPDF